MSLRQLMRRSAGSRRCARGQGKRKRCRSEVRAEGDAWPYLLRNLRRLHEHGVFKHSRSESVLACLGQLGSFNGTGILSFRSSLRWDYTGGYRPAEAKRPETNEEARPALCPKPSVQTPVRVRRRPSGS